MNSYAFQLILEILAFLANLATVLGFVLERWEKHKRQRMEAEENGKAGGNRPS